MIYLDYSANTPVDPAVLSQFCRIEQSYIGNPNSGHAAGAAAAAKLTQATEHIAAMLNVEPAEIIYTSGASESNNLAVKGIARAMRHSGRHIISTALEHASVGGCLSALQEQGYEIDLVGVNCDGTIDLEQFRELLREDTILAAFCAVDSELGTIQPMEQITEILNDYPRCHLHVDATQAVGKTAFCFDGVDTMSLAPHKFYGLNGSGLLLKRRDLIIEPLIHGGTATTIYRSGSPALALAAATETALDLALTHREERSAAVKKLNEQLRTALLAYPLVRINSPDGGVPHILNLSVMGVKASAFRQALDDQGICVSVKSACSTEDTPSKAVYAVSRNRKQALSSWRISMSHLTTQAEIETFLAAFDRCYRNLTAGA